MTSSQNTIRASNVSEPEPLNLETEADGSPEKDEALDALAKQLEAAKDARREERFIWMVACVILVDVLWFRNAPNATIPIVVLLLEAVVLFILAKRMGIEEISQLFERLIHGITRTGNQ